MKYQLIVDPNDVDAATVRKYRDETGAGLYDTLKKFRAEQRNNALSILQTYAGSEDPKVMAEVLHDILELLKVS